MLNNMHNADATRVCSRADDKPLKNKHRPVYIIQHLWTLQSHSLTSTSMCTAVLALCKHQDHHTRHNERHGHNNNNNTATATALDTIDRTAGCRRCLFSTHWRWKRYNCSPAGRACSPVLTQSHRNRARSKCTGAAAEWQAPCHGSSIQACHVPRQLPHVCFPLWHPSE